MRGADAEDYPGRRTQIVSVGKEPSFPPLHVTNSASALVGTIRNALTFGSLRPDVVVRVDRQGRPPRMLVLDAKNRPNFQQEDLRSARDSRSLLLEGRLGDTRSGYRAALCMLPDQGECLLQLSQRFPEVDGDHPGRAGPSRGG